MSDNDLIARLERVNYEAMIPIADVTPGLDLLLRDDVILSSSSVFPAPDTTHACLLQATPDTVDALIAEIVGYFSDKSLPVTLLVSPACTPSDLSDRLLVHGFERQTHEESWVVLDELEKFEFRSRRQDVTVRAIVPGEAMTFAEIFLAAFEMPREYASTLADMLRPSVGLPQISHYLAYVGEDCVGTISITEYGQYGIFGSAGILPAYRGSKVALELFRAIYGEAQQHGLNTLIAQTRLGSTAERLLLANQFERDFTRHIYTLVDAG